MLSGATCVELNETPVRDLPAPRAAAHSVSLRLLIAHHLPTGQLIKNVTFFMGRNHAGGVILAGSWYLT